MKSIKAALFFLLLSGNSYLFSDLSGITKSYLIASGLTGATLAGIYLCYKCHKEVDSTRSDLHRIKSALTDMGAQIEESVKYSPASNRETHHFNITLNLNCSYEEREHQKQLYWELQDAFHKLSNKVSNLQLAFLPTYFLTFIMAYYWYDTLKTPE